MGFFSKLFGGGEKKPQSFAGQQVYMRQFDGEDLRGADFSRAQLHGCGFRGCNLEGASFRGAIMQVCFFQNANLKNAILDEADCMGADFTGANLEGVSTFKTQLMAAQGVPPSMYSSLDDIVEESDKWPLIRQKLETLTAVVPGGAIRELRDDGEMFYAGSYRNRNFRVLSRVHGGLELEVKVQPGHRFSVFHDKEAEPTHGNDADPVWGESNSYQRHFFGPGVYIEQPPKDLAQLKAKLAGDLPGMFAHFLAAANAEKLEVYDDLIKIEFRDDLLSGDFPQRMRVGLEFIDNVAGQLRV